MRAEILVGRERRRRWSAAAKQAIVGEAFAPGARVASVARRRDVSRSQIYQWRAALQEVQLAEPGSEVVGFVPVELCMASDATPKRRLPEPGGFTTTSAIEISLAGGRCLKVPACLPTTALRRLIRAVEGA